MVIEDKLFRNVAGESRRLVLATLRCRYMGQGGMNVYEQEIRRRGGSRGFGEGGGSARGMAKQDCGKVEFPQEWSSGECMVVL